MRRRRSVRSTWRSASRGGCAALSAGSTSEDLDEPARLLCGTTEGFVEVTAPWVVACDGAHSPVRESLGVQLEGETYPERFLVASVDEQLDDMVEESRT
ncbi:MAG: FAD-dependent monooxygenase [Microthrixaceae bacterium]